MDLLFLLNGKTFSFPIFVVVSLLLSSSLVFAMGSNNTSKASQQQCFHDQLTSLLRLKQSFRFFPPSRTNLSSWVPDNTDFCSWEGITCDPATGYVISLDLSGRKISGSIDSESLSHLCSLKTLNLSDNGFDISPFPSGFDQLLSLTHLNLSNLNFHGQIPLDMARLTSLVSLDLSFNGYESLSLKLENPGIRTLVQNLSSLRELRMDGVNMSVQGREWGQAISSSLPNLHKLSLSRCGLLGPIHSSLSQLHFLSELDLSENRINSVVPSFLGNFSLLTSLRLRNCNLFGSLPSSLVNLTKLHHLDLSSNLFRGPIPSSYASELVNLKVMILSDNQLNGTIPSSILSHPIMQVLDLGSNQLGDQLEEFGNASSSQLEVISLGDNNLQGMIPSSIFRLGKLQILSLPFNNFSGRVEVGLFQNLKNLLHLDLSENNLSIDDGGGNTTSLSFPQMQKLELRSCNIRKFPSFLRNQERLGYIDLSNNSMEGEIPEWIWRVRNETSYYLNLSQNFLQGIESSFPHLLPSPWVVLDLSSNLLEGSLPIPQPSTVFFSLSQNNFSGEIPTSFCKATSLQVLDLSRNSLGGSIPQCLSEISASLNALKLQVNSFTGTMFQTFQEGCNLRTLDLSWNNLQGPVPFSLVNCKMLWLLNLGNNQVDDTFPSWTETLQELRILVLRSNRFYGPIANVLTDQGFPQLRIIDISSNSFTGSLPPNIFRNWKAMMMEDYFADRKLLGRHLHARQVDVYYQDMVTITAKGREGLTYSQFVRTLFTVVDLSNNHFEGDIPESLGNFNSLLVLNMSRNNFTGPIPASLGNLRPLEALDLSRNELSGKIPFQLAELTFLEVVDLSRNHLVGRIPYRGQFLTFPNDWFQGNLGLCGPPLSGTCVEEPPPPSEDATSELDREVIIMLIGFGGGYAAGMGVFLLALSLWKKGRKEYNKLIDRMLLLILPSTMLAPKRQPKGRSKHGKVGRAAAHGNRGVRK